MKWLFYVRFRDHKAKVIKQDMLKDTRISAGLGYAHDHC